MTHDLLICKYNHNMSILYSSYGKVYILYGINTSLTYYVSFRKKLFSDVRIDPAHCNGEGGPYKNY